MYEIVLGRSKPAREKYGLRGTIYLGKHYIKMGEALSLANKVHMDVSGPHVILVSGKRGCLPGDHKIFTNKGYKEIKDFDKFNDKILAFDKNEVNFVWSNANLLRYDIENEDLIKLTLQDGREISVTEEHPLLVYHKNAVLVWRKGKDLEEGDLIVTTTVLPEVKKDEESLEIARILGATLADGNIFIQKGRWKDGRGYWYNGTKKRLRVDTDSEAVCLQIKKDIEKEFGVKARFTWRKDCNCGRVRSTNSKVVDKLVKLGVPAGKKSGIIRVPEIVWRSSNEFKANFLNTLISCDGYIQNDGMRIEYYTNSKKFAKDLQLLLAHFSIESVMRKKRRSDRPNYISYRIGFSDYTSIVNYREKIGFINEKKAERLHLKKFHISKRRRCVKYIGDDLVCSRVKHIEKHNGVDQVYDLQVPGASSFVANGIISHNSGKSYTLGVIAEELVNMPEEVSKNIACLIFDTMGLYWTMRYPNYRDGKLLSNWDLKPKKLTPVVFVPKGLAKQYEEKGVRFEESFSLKPADVSIENWAKIFELDLNSEEGLLLERVILQFEGRNFSIDELIAAINADKKSSVRAKMILSNRYASTKRWGLFDKEGTELSKLFIGGQTSVLDLSAYAQVERGTEIKALVIGLLSDKMLKERLLARKEEEAKLIDEGAYLTEGEVFAGEKSPLIWILIDEAHEFIPNDRETLASHPLIQILKEGRQPGLTLVLATQQPGSIAADALTQADIVLSHRVTAKIDVDALGDVMQTYLPHKLKTYIRQLPGVKGCAVVLDDKLERIYPIQIRPRFSWHGGAEPTALTKDIVKSLELKEKVEKD